jgi:hypothetical protein
VIVRLQIDGEPELAAEVEPAAGPVEPAPGTPPERAADSAVEPEVVPEVEPEVDPAGASTPRLQ